MVGTVGGAGFFSFAPRKVLAGTGNGGMVVTRDPDLARSVRLPRLWPPSEHEVPVARRLAASGAGHVVEGHNLNLDPIQAAVLGPKFPRLDAWAALRQHVADCYGERLHGVTEIKTPEVPDTLRHAWRNYVITIPARDRVRAAPRETGIATAVLYTPPVHLQPVYRELGLGPGSCPGAEAVAPRLLALPMNPGLADEQVDEVADALVEAVHDARVAPA